MLVSRVVRPEPPIEPVYSGLLGTAVAVLTFALVVRLIGVPMRAIFLVQPSLRTLQWAGAGVTIATTLVLFTMVVTDGAVGIGTISLDSILLHLAVGAAIGLWTGTVEELVLRGLLLSIIGHQWHWPGAICVTSLLFGAMHHAHAPASHGVVLYVTLTTIAGLFFALVTVSTGNVWNAVALHGAWNAVFHETVVSLARDPASDALIQYTVETNVWLVGGSHAAVTESLAAVLLFAGIVTAYLWYRLATIDGAHQEHNQ